MCLLELPPDEMRRLNIDGFVAIEQHNDEPRIDMVIKCCTGTKSIPCQIVIK